jgi:hypothetical protein
MLDPKLREREREGEGERERVGWGEPERALSESMDLYSIIYVH